MEKKESGVRFLDGAVPFFVTFYLRLLRAKVLGDRWPRVLVR